jgi:hypothetical protein
MKLNRSIVVVVVLLLLFAAAPSESESQTVEPQIKFIPLNTPEPANISELRRNSKMEKLDQCSVPVITVGGDWTRSLGPDEFFEITLPPDWRLEKIDSTGLVPDPRATFRGANGDRASITRRANGATSMSYMRNADGVIKPERQCEVSNDKSGSVFSFYSGVITTSGAVRSIVLGDAVTPEGKRYGIDLASASSARLDTLVAFVSQAILTGRQH